MFGPNKGPFPEGKHIIYVYVYDGVALTPVCTTLTATSIQDCSPVVRSSIDRNTILPKVMPLGSWIFKYGAKGYKIKNEASGGFLTYTKHTIPGLVADFRPRESYNHLITSWEIETEWELVQTRVGLTGASTSTASYLGTIFGPEMTSPLTGCRIAFNSHVFRPRSVSCRGRLPLWGRPQE